MAKDKIIQGLYVVYSPVNQRWFLFWFAELLSTWETKSAALAEKQRLLGVN